MDKKLFYVVDNGDSSMTVSPDDLANTLEFGFDDYDSNTPTDDLPVYTINPVYMTQEEYDNMPEYNG